ncbi:hypothetical protein GCM10010344_10330 [Streptomyces bluensis]|nr:hypothetical protein GCM10010344_10330 [Streptomyces bluensis]
MIAVRFVSSASQEEEQPDTSVRVPYARPAGVVLTRITSAYSPADTGLKGARQGRGSAGRRGITGPDQVR